MWLGLTSAPRWRVNVMNYRSQTEFCGTLSLAAYGQFIAL